MAKSISERYGAENPPKRLQIDVSKCLDMDIQHFVTKNTKSFFYCLDIPFAFLDSDPETWASRDDYATALETVTKLNVVNYVAERGVALIEEYNSIITRNEEQKQYLLQVVQDHRRLFSDCKKSSLIE